MTQPNLITMSLSAAQLTEVLTYLVCIISNISVKVQGYQFVISSHQRLLCKRHNASSQLLRAFVRVTDERRRAVSDDTKMVHRKVRGADHLLCVKLLYIYKMRNESTS